MSAESPWDVAARALQLRAWALRLLAHGSAGEPPAASPRAWDVFVRSERCAIALRSAPLPAEARAIVERCATAELQRFLSVQAQTRLVGALLRERGWPGVVLKGTAHAAEGGEPLDVADVDILVPREHAVEFAALLEERGGHQAIGGSDPAGASGTGWQLAMRIAEGGVQVEVHFDVPFASEGVDVWEGTLATPVRGVLRLSAANHLWHVLVHGAVHHLDRRGSLRELLLLRSAHAACSADDLREVERRAASHPAARPLLAILAMTAALARGADVEDAFRAAAAARYGLSAGAGKRVGRMTGLAVFGLLEGDGAYRSLWMGNASSALVGPGFRGTTLLDRFALPAWAVRVAFRSARLAAATLPAWRLARAARRVADSPVSPGR